MSIQIRKAVRQRVWLKVAIMGPSGSGKTYGSIALAKGLAPTGKILLVDTENRSASYYADKWDFDVVEMEGPFSSQKYHEALDAAVAEGYEVVIFDSMSHEWAATGGVLDRKATLDRQKGEKWGNWQDAKTPHSLFREAWLQAPIHVIATMRSKMEYVLEQNEKGKQVPRKVGLAPIQEGDAEYEFGVAFEVDRDTHLATASKDRTRLFDGRNFHLGEAVGRELAAWLSSGAAPTPAPEPTPAPAVERAAPIPEKDYPKEAGAVFQQLQEEVTAAKAEPGEAASTFVDSLEPTTDPTITLSEFGELTDLCVQHKVPLDKLQAYCIQHGKLAGETLRQMKRTELGPLTACITSDTKRRALVAHLANYGTTAA